MYSLGFHHNPTAKQDFTRQRSSLRYAERPLYDAMRWGRAAGLRCLPLPLSLSLSLSLGRGCC
jgi:hypothetical protein